MGDENPIRTLGDYSEPSHEGYRNTIELPVGNNVKHGLVSRTYYKNSLIMALIVGFRSKIFMTMSIPSQDEPLTNRPVVMSEQDELLSSVVLDFQARLDDGQMYLGHLEAKRLP
nr:hypothetical protein [Tanacetum cinerariifolium]